MKGNLLLVDDESILLECLKTILEDFADQTFTAFDGKKAYEIIKTNEIHCVVCDINMPVMNGLELIKKLSEGNFKIPFIFYTGHGSRDLMLEAAKYGAFDFLDKPQFTGLDECVKRALAIGTSSDEVPAADGFISEYRRMLMELDKKV